MAGYQSALSPTTFQDTAGARPRGSRNGGVFTEGSFCDCALQDPNVLPVRLEDAAGARGGGLALDGVVEFHPRRLAGSRPVDAAP